MKKPVPILRVLTLKAVFVLAAFLVSPPTLQASEEMDALLKVLLRRNIITQEDVDAIKAEAAAMVAKEEEAAAELQPSPPEEAPVPVPDAPAPPPAPENIIQVSEQVGSVKLYANARYRFHHQDLVSASGQRTYRRRPLYRVKLGSVTQFEDSPFSLGVQLETATTNDSTNTDFGGFWDKRGGGINVGRFYVDYHIDDDTRVTFGKHGGIYTLPTMLWGSDLNPEGLSQRWKSGPVTFLAGQYLIDNENESLATATDPEVGDDYMFMIQAILQAGDLTAAPLFMTSTGGQSTYPEKGPFSGVNSQQYFRHFDLALLPFDYKLGPGKIFGAVGRNFENKSLQSDPSSPFFDVTGSGKDRGNLALLGYQHGLAKSKGQSQWSLEYRYIEGAAYNPNLSDPDWSRGMINQAGFVFNYKYRITDFLELSGTFMEGSSIDESFASPAANFSESEIILIDAMFSF